MTRTASLHRPGLRYDAAAPFDPPYPLYAAVEELLAALGLDPARRGTAAWNPLGDLVRPGGRVVIKPNLVSHKNLHARIDGRKLEASSTHGSLLRPLLDYALRAVGPAGRVRVLDAPIEGCVLADVAGPLGVFAVVEQLAKRGAPVDFVDLRTSMVQARMLLDDVRWRGRSLNVGALIRDPLPGDPEGYRVVDLANRSAFEAPGAPAAERLCFHRSAYHAPVAHHRAGRHEYSIPRSVLDADLIVSLPKLKTHKKTGVTLGLKNTIGLTNEKQWLPHFTAGDPTVGGDEYPRPPTLREQVASYLSRAPLPGGHSLILRAPRVDATAAIMDGSWEGNRTLWRTILDLNLALLYADRSGGLQPAPQRRMLTVLDGVVAGEGEGPMGATPLSAGLLLAGTHAARLERRAVRMMGFDPDKIPLIERAVAVLDPSAEPDEHVHLGPPFAHRFTPPRSWPSLRAGARDTPDA